MSRLSTIALLLACAQALAAQPRQPNVLVICADDHAAYVTGAYGNKTVRTPAIDALAAGGIRFERAYCNSPVCTASRQSFFTGRYPRTIGVTRLETALPESEVTLAETLHAAGYATAGIGKMHFNSPRKHGFELRIDREDYLPWLARQNPGVPSESQRVQGKWRPFIDPARIWLNSDCLPMGLADGHMDAAYFAQQAADYIAEKRERPFFLMVSFYEPHSPYYFPLEYRDRHDPARFTVPTIGPEDDAQIPMVFRDLSEREKQGIAAAYYTSVEYVDANVGRVLAALDRSGQRDDTIVVYLGDHGYMLGQHGRFEKHSSYEEAVRVPFVLSYPRRIAAGRVSHAFVELVDLAPTIYNLCGLPVPAAVQGRSLSELLAGRTVKHREHVIVEYAPNDEVMIRDGDWKLVYERGAQRRTDGYDIAGALVPHQFRLYDLTADPEELHNVASAANAAIMARLAERLVEHLSTTARQVELVPRTSDPLALLDYLVQSRDVPRPGKRD